MKDFTFACIECKLMDVFGDTVKLLGTFSMYFKLEGFQGLLFRMDNPLVTLIKPQISYILDLKL